MNKEELKNNLKSITDKFVGKENNEETRQQVQDKLREYLEPIVTKYINKKYNIIVNVEGVDVYKYDDYDEKYLKVEFKISPTTTCMSDEEFKRISEAATDALTDMELKGYDIECKLRGVENVHLNNSKRNNKK